MSLSDLVRKPQPQASPVVTVSPNGMRSRFIRCERHGCEYFGTWLPGYPELPSGAPHIGSCKECDLQEALETKARDLAKQRPADLSRKITERLNRSAVEITAEIEKRCLAMRSQVELEVRESFVRQVREQCNEELIAEIANELRAAKEKQ